jgi:carbamoyltransferase
MKGACLGPEFGDDAIGSYLTANNYSARKLSSGEWAPEIARLIDEQKVVGLFQGRMEFGPRALGNRSIVGDARSPQMQSVMNLKIKYRESFRPFAPSCLVERAGDFFEMDAPSPYMLLVAFLRSERRRERPGGGASSLRDRVNEIRSDVPAITHVDYSARVQTVSRDVNPRYYDLIKAFEERTGYGIIINTSFNVRGEPLVCTPEDAYRCFMRTEMDCLVLGSYLLLKEQQPRWSEKTDWRQDFVLD